MNRRLIHALLALTLALNGISAPWAMVPMSHAGHGSGDIPAGHHLPDEVAKPSEPSPTHAGHHGHVALADGMTSAHQEPDSDLSEACCNAAACQCGCVLPPVVPFFRMEFLPVLIEHALFAPVLAHVVKRRVIAPFRPPAA